MTRMRQANHSPKAVGPIFTRLPWLVPDWLKCVVNGSSPG
jgi:hypothetical protein